MENKVPEIVRETTYDQANRHHMHPAGLWNFSCLAPVNSDTRIQGSPTFH